MATGGGRLAEGVGLQGWTTTGTASGVGPQVWMATGGGRLADGVGLQGWTTTGTASGVGRLQTDGHRRRFPGLADTVGRPREVRMYPQGGFGRARRRKKGKIWWEEEEASTGSREGLSKGEARARDPQ
jgi:hypothetical protein